jgi:hypothetical protein
MGEGNSKISGNQPMKGLDQPGPAFSTLMNAFIV